MTSFSKRPGEKNGTKRAGEMTVLLLLYLFVLTRNRYVYESLNAVSESHTLAPYRAYWRIYGR